MVTELSPEALVRDSQNDKRRAPDNRASRESTAGSKPNVPHKIRTTSSCSLPEREDLMVADVQLKKGKGGAQDIGLETPDNSEAMETAPESEESKLEYCCTFCNKVFKGSRVVAHAMFHYRKDECMFCGTVFKDDLLAMMHLSNHIEKLKKSKELETKAISTPKTSAKGKTTNVSSGRRSSGRMKKSVCLQSESPEDSSPPESRKLRSNDKTGDGQFLQKKKQNTSKHLIRKSLVHKLNGHFGRKKEQRWTDKKGLKNNQTLTPQESSQARTSGGSENPELLEDQHIEMDSSASSVQAEKEFGCSAEDKMKETESLQVLKAATKQNGKDVEEKNVEPQEKVCCPVEGCAWFTDLSKSRVALLYHALEDHSGEPKPLELAFRVGNSKCAICMRVLWSFEHFQHHVERHKISPRHPCLHQGCTARFKTGMEMRRHARRHSPLQAVCCLPGCSQLFICLWALNLHEREHYASKSTKPDKITNVQADDERDTATGKKQQDHKSKAATAVNKSVGVKAARKLRGKTAHNSRKYVRTLSSVRTSLLKEKIETKDSNVLKNLSNKDASTQLHVPNLRVRQSLRKGQVTNAALAAPKSHRVISSSLLKHTSKVMQKFKKKPVKVNPKGLKRRGRPPKSKKTVHDENTSTGQNNESGKDKPGLQKDPKRSAQPASPPKATDASSVSDQSTEEKSKQNDDVLKTAVDESKLKKLLKKNHVKQTAGERDNGSSQSVTITSQKVNANRINEVHKSKKRSPPKESSQTDSDFSKSKKHKVTNSKVNTKNVKKSCPVEDPASASEKSVGAKAVVPQVEAKVAVVVESSADEDGKAKAGNTDSTQNSTANTLPAVELSSLSQSAPAAASGQKTQKEAMEKKKSHITKKERHKEIKSKVATLTPDKANKKHKDVSKKGDKKIVKEKRPCNDPSKTSASKKTAKSESAVHQPDETKTAADLANSTCDEEGKVAAGSPDVTLHSSGPPLPAKTSPTATQGKTQMVAKKSKTSNDTKQSDPNKANKKRKSIHKEGDTNIVKKKCKEQAVPSATKEPAKSKTEVQPPTQAKAEEEKPVTETTQSPASSSATSFVTNGQVSSEDIKSTACRDSIANYSKKPYMRLPPTAYLDEKYITMPKRRKELSLFQPYQKSLPAGQATVTGTPQRQRCANCFATFNSAEDLQSHLQLQKCSNLFGFDSDDEGNS